jgi:hypothetical protein
MSNERTSLTMRTFLLLLVVPSLMSIAGEPASLASVSYPAPGTSRFSVGQMPEGFRMRSKSKARDNVFRSWKLKSCRHLQISRAAVANVDVSGFLADSGRRFSTGSSAIYYERNRRPHHRRPQGEYRKSQKLYYGR